MLIYGVDKWEAEAVLASVPNIEARRLEDASGPKRGPAVSLTLRNESRDGMYVKWGGNASPNVEWARSDNVCWHGHGEVLLRMRDYAHTQQRDFRAVTAVDSYEDDYVKDMPASESDWLAKQFKIEPQPVACEC